MKRIPVLLVALAVVLAGCDSTTLPTVKAKPVVSLTAPLYTPPTPTPTSSAPSKPAPISTKAVGATVSVEQTGSEAGTATYTVNGLQTGATARFSTPNQGQFVVIDVTIEGLTGTLNYNPYDFKIQMQDDRVYEPTFAGFDPMLSSGTIGPGQKVRGNIVFDVPVGPIAQVQLVGGRSGLIAVWTP